MVKIKLLMSHFVANKQNGLTLMPSEGTDLFISKLNMKTVIRKNITRSGWEGLVD
jgi:hypothetical protein